MVNAQMLQYFNSNVDILSKTMYESKVYLNT